MSGPTRLDRLKREYAGRPIEAAHAVDRLLHGGDFSNLPTDDIKRLLERARRALQA